jgi:cobalamin synthase
MNRPLARWSSIQPSQRLRIIGILVIVVGVSGAGLFYWIQARSAAPSMDELFPGYSRNRARQVGILMGSMTVTLIGLLDALKDPFTASVIVAAVSGCVALIFFRLASVMDQSNRHLPAAPIAKDKGE